MGIQISRKNIQDWIKQYDDQKGLLREFFGDQDFIMAVRSYLTDWKKEWKPMGEKDLLTNEELYELLHILTTKSFQPNKNGLSAKIANEIKTQFGQMYFLAEKMQANFTSEFFNIIKDADNKVISALLNVKQEDLHFMAMLSKENVMTFDLLQAILLYPHVIDAKLRSEWVNSKDVNRSEKIANKIINRTQQAEVAKNTRSLFLVHNRRKDLQKFKVISEKGLFDLIVKYATPATSKPDALLTEKQKEKIIESELSNLKPEYRPFSKNNK